MNRLTLLQQMRDDRSDLVGRFVRDVETSLRLQVRTAATTGILDVTEVICVYSDGWMVDYDPVI